MSDFGLGVIAGVVGAVVVATIASIWFDYDEARRQPSPEIYLIPIDRPRSDPEA